MRKPEPSEKASNSLGASGSMKRRKKSSNPSSSGTSGKVGRRELHVP